MAGWMRAADTFVADMDDGTPFPVKQGDVFPDNHQLIKTMFKRDKDGAGRLFRPLESGEDEAPVRSRGRAGRGLA